MKKWNNPELLSLGVENTFEDGIETIASWGTHTCHGPAGEHSGNCSNGKGHTAIITGQCKDHLNDIKHTENGINYSCCCSTNLVGTEIPGVS